jgi:hypothetical protein
MDVICMTTHRRPTIRHCPVCRIAMQATKSRDNLDDLDMFKCLACETTIHEPKSGAPWPRGMSEK